MRLIYLLLPLSLHANPHWSEQDESDRIAAIIAAEKRAFEEEMKPRQQARYRNDYNAEYSNGMMDNYQQEYDRRYRSRSRERQPIVTTTTTTEQPSAEALSSSEEATRRGDNWCYLCASPLALLSSGSRKAVQQFLDIRRTTFPKGATTKECITPRNFSALHKQECKHKFCQTLVLMDHEEGSSFVMRGCAEHFGAVNKDILEAREDNTCVRLHDKLDIRECICRDRKSCYAGKLRSTASYQSILPTIIGVALYRLMF